MNARAMISTLVCDDEPDAREGIIGLLRTDPEIALVGEARNGAESMTAFARLSPELVFVDVQMPKMDGLKLVEKGRRKGIALSWQDLVSGDAAVARALQASLAELRQTRS